MNLEGKVALVLGSIKGIGKAIGLDLASDGAKLVLTYHDWQEHLDRARADFNAAGCEYLMVEVDLRDQCAVEELISKVMARFGRLDILINNIERGGWPVVHGPYTTEQWDLELATTLRAKQWMLQAALPYLKASGQATVVNISSIAGIVGRSGPASLVFNDGYAAANRGVSLLTETWARLGAPEVRVNELMIGIVETRHGPQTRGWGLLSEQQKQALVEHTLLGRTGKIEDVVAAVRFLVQGADFMTGAVLRLDGGYVLGGEPVAPMPVGVV